MYHSTSTFFHHNSTVPPVHWQDGPNTRGTWDIISSCVITLCLCLWTALHLNIPEHHGTIIQRWRKLGWLLTGLLAPEMVVFTALEQRRAALRLTKEMQASFGEKQASDWPKLLRCLRPKRSPPVSDDAVPSERELNITDRRHRWTHVHSFYALMGGFVFDTSSAPAKFLPLETTRLTVRFQGLRYIAKHAPSLVPDISEEDIRDKSKADSLAKVLVCLQAIWFCVQCIVRVAQDQDISFLELNTFAHAVCTLMTYALWWHKPLDIESPSLIVGDEAWEMCALMYVTSNGEIFLDRFISRYLFRRHFSPYSENWRETELSRGQKYGDRVIARWKDIFDGRHLVRLQEHQNQRRAILRWDPVPDSVDKSRRSHSQPSEAVQVRKGDSIFGFRCMEVYTQADWCRAFPASKDRWVFPGQKDHRHALETREIIWKERKYQDRVIAKQVEGHEPIHKECTFQPLDLKRWELVSRGWQKYQPTFREYDPFARSLRPRLYNGIDKRMRNWPRTSFSFLDGYVTLDIRLLTFSVAAGLYGGLHLLAWEAPFRSEPERFCWRASGSLLVMSGFVVILGIPFGLACRLIDFLGDKSDEASTLSAAGLDLLGLVSTMTLAFPPCMIMGVFLMAYIPARIFLILDSCLQLARLPQGAYTTPDWSKYYPHIS